MLAFLTGRRPRRPVAVATSGVAALALALAGCGGTDGQDTSGDQTPTPPAATVTPSPSSTVQVPDDVELTEQGSDLTFGDSAEVIFESTQNTGTVLDLTVRSVTRGRLADFDGFILDDAYKKKASYYYVRVRVKNVGGGTIGGVSVPLWGVNEKNTLLPGVNFTTEFGPCPSSPLPTRFQPGDTLSTCLVYLAPDRGSLQAVSYRPSQQFDPIAWTGTIRAPAKASGDQAPAKKDAPKKGAVKKGAAKKDSGKKSDGAG